MNYIFFFYRMTVKMKVLTLSNEDIFYQIRIHFIEYEYFIAWKFHSIENENIIYRMNVLSTRETKTCCAGQSKFKVLPIKPQSLRAHLVTFWRHLRKHLNGGKVSLFYYPTRAGILSFVVLKITMNDRKSIGEFLWDINCDLLQYAGDLRKKGSPQHCLRGIWQKKIYIFSLKALKN